MHRTGITRCPFPSENQYKSALAHRAIGRSGCTMAVSIVGARSSSTRARRRASGARAAGTLASAATTYSSADNRCTRTRMSAESSATAADSTNVRVVNPPIPSESSRGVHDDSVRAIARRAAACATIAARAERVARAESRAAAKAPAMSAAPSARRPSTATSTTPRRFLARNLGAGRRCLAPRQAAAQRDRQPLTAHQGATTPRRRSPGARCRNWWTARSTAP